MNLNSCEPDVVFSDAIKQKIQSNVDKASRDFRSDVVTAPTESMMQAILLASVGDDVYDKEGDPSMNALEAKILELTGKEAALWTTSGTQANQICLRAHLTSPPQSVLLDHRAHVHCSEAGALPVLSQASVTMVVPSNGLYLTLDDVKENIIPAANMHHTPTRVVSLENTLSGIILPLSEAQSISRFVRSYPVPEGQKPIAMHLDGARIFDAVVAEGVDLRDYAACFDSMSICLSKGLGAPMGSILVGSKQFVQRARVIRKMLGGGTRQPGMMAAAAHAAIDYAIPRLSHVHKLAKSAGEKLEAIGYKLKLPVQTNMIVLDLPKSGVTSSAFIGYCEKESLQVFHSGRLVFHHQTSEESVEKLVGALTRLIEDSRSGVAGDGGPTDDAGHC